MASANLKIKAVCLILLLAGQEAHRIRSDARLTLAMQHPVTPAEDRWNEMNKQCTWNVRKIFQGGCSGEGCTLRPLPLDKSLSESCRLSDSYMLKNTSRQGEFVELAAQILEAKSAKFRDGCAGAKLWEVSKQFDCHRRAGHMLRSAALISKAGKADEWRIHEKQRVERALSNIASAFGTDGQHILEFKTKLEGDISSFAKDPTGKFKQMISTVSKLLSGNERDKYEARHAIIKMPTKHSRQDSRKTKKELDAAAKQLIHDYNLDDLAKIDEAWSNLDRLASKQKNDEASALLQAEGQVGSQNWFLTWLLINLVLNVLILIICLIFGITNFFWVLVVVLITLLFAMLLGAVKSGAKGQPDGPTVSKKQLRRGRNNHGHRTGIRQR